MSLKKFMEKANQDYGLLPGWVTVLAEKAYSAGMKEGKCREKRRNRAYAIPAPKKERPRCDKPGCYREATWDVCMRNGMGTARCGLHLEGKGLTLKMFRLRRK